jgi:AcrR family transcriptional regulator
MRADALRNRDKLLAAAAERFSADGRDASLEAIAKQAGVGVGTLYRHFPTREALVEATYMGEMEALRAAAFQALEDGPPDAALESWMHAFVRYAAERRGIKDALKAFTEEPDFEATRAVMLEGLTAILDAGAADGSLRPDLEPHVVLRAASGLWTLAGEPDWEANAAQLIEILMPGLRNRR